MSVSEDRWVVLILLAVFCWETLRTLSCRQQIVSGESTNIWRRPATLCNPLVEKAGPCDRLAVSLNEG